jgi:predicted nucleotidyltransferase
MAMNHDKRYLEKRGCEMKKFMYHLRGLLASKFTAIYGTYPPVLFNELVEKMVSDKPIKAEIADLVRLKQESREHNTMIVSDFLVAFATETAAEIEAMFGTFPGENPADFKRLDEFFLNILNTFDI